MAGALVFGKASLNYVSPKTLSFLQTVSGLVLCGVTDIILGIIYEVTHANSLIMLSYLLYGAIVCTIGGYMLQNIALEHISAKLVGMAQCIYPVATAVVAFFVLGEALTPLGIVGAIIITICVILENAI